MTIIIDECLPKRLTQFFAHETAWTVPQIGLSGAKDGELLDTLDRKKIDVFITIDGNIEYQQQFANRTFGTVIIRSVSSRFADLVALESMLVELHAPSQQDKSLISHKSFRCCGCDLKKVCVARVYWCIGYLCIRNW